MNHHDETIGSLAIPCRALLRRCIAFYKIETKTLAYCMLSRSSSTRADRVRLGLAKTQILEDQENVLLCFASFLCLHKCEAWWRSETLQ